MEPFNQYSSFPYQQNKQKNNSITPEGHSDFHDYDNHINPRRHTYDRYNFRPQPRKDYRIFSAKKTYFHFLKIPAERKLEIFISR